MAGVRSTFVKILNKKTLHWRAERRISILGRCQRSHQAIRNTPSLLVAVDPGGRKQQCRWGTTYRPHEIPQDGCPFILSSPYRDVDVPKIPLTAYVMEKFSKYGKKIAFIDGETGREWSYGELQTAVTKVGSALVKLGYKRGDLVTIFSSNCPEYAIMYLALAHIGVTASSVNPVYTVAELSHALLHSESRAVITTPALFDTAKQAAARVPSIKDTFTFGDAPGCRSMASLLEDDGSAWPVSVDLDLNNDTVALPYSSGTTGLPKGVMLTNNSIVTNLEQLRYDDVLDYHETDVFIAVLPFFHIYGQVAVLLLGLAAGCKIITVPKFDPFEYLKICQMHKVSVLHIAPPISLFMSTHPCVDDFNLSSIKSIICGAAPLGSDVIKKVCERLDMYNFRQAYGMTEMSPATHINPKEVERQKYDSVGFPVPNTMCKLVHTETGEMLGIHQDGEVLVRGPQVMKGYFKNDEATANTVRDGWIHSGDIGRFDEDGHLYIVDRVKELIKYKGFQVAPAELEAALLTHPAVDDTAVIGVPDKQAGELPRGYVVLKDGHKATPEELHAFVDKLVAPYKKLRGGIEFRPHIPKSASGKILRRQLKEEYLISKKK